MSEYEAVNHCYHDLQVSFIRLCSMLGANNSIGCPSEYVPLVNNAFLCA